MDKRQRLAMRYRGGRTVRLQRARGMRGETLKGLKAAWAEAMGEVMRHGFSLDPGMRVTFKRFEVEHDL